MFLKNRHRVDFVDLEIKIGLNKEITLATEAERVTSLYSRY